jgi:hypothetical protein
MHKQRRDTKGNDPFPGSVATVVSGVFIAWIVVPATDPRSLASWDILLISGIVALIVGLRLARQAPDRVGHTLRRLIHRGALQGAPADPESVREALESTARTWAGRGAGLVAVAVFAAFAIVMLRARSLYRLPLALFEVYWAYIAGWQLGRMAAYGRLGAALGKAGINVRAIPGHLDGAAGLKPVGDLFFFQSMVAAIPAIFLAAWWLLIPVWPRDYSFWRAPYVGLLAASIVVEMLAFFVPMWFFHVAMRTEKERLLQTADKLSEQVAALQVELAQPTHDPPRHELQERLSLMTKQYWDIEQMPTWPVDFKTRRHFALSNVTLVLPLLSEVVGLTPPWQRLVEAAGKIIG